MYLSMKLWNYERQDQQGHLDIPQSTHILQLILENAKAFLEQ